MVAMSGRRIDDVFGSIFPAVALPADDEVVALEQPAAGQPSG